MQEAYHQGTHAQRIMPLLDFFQTNLVLIQVQTIEKERIQILSKRPTMALIQDILNIMQLAKASSKKHWQPLHTQNIHATKFLFRCTTHIPHLLQKQTKSKPPKGQLKENRNLGSLGSLSRSNKMAKMTFFLTLKSRGH